MRKIAFIFCFLLIYFYSFGQDYSFSVGLTYQPFIYNNYNHSDWNNRPQSYPINQGKFNGKAFGITFSKSVSDHISINADLLYSSQNQMHAIRNSTYTDPIDQSVYTFYGRSVSTNFDIYRMPVQISFSNEIGYGSGIYVKGSIGPRISYLGSFSSEYLEYDIDITNKKINYDLLINRVLYTNNNFDQTILRGSPPMYQSTHHTVEYMYNRFLFGMGGGIEFQKVISGKIIVALGGRIGYDLTNSERHPEFVFPGLGGTMENSTRSKSHHFEYGLSTSVSYCFN